MAKDRYVSDVPVVSRDADRLKRWPFAQRIAETLATRSDPASLVVGVYGRWGEGKTTVLEFIEQSLMEHENVVVLRFNPWLFTSDVELLLGFFAQLAAAIDRKLESTKGKIGGFLKRYGGLVAGLSGIDLAKIGEELATSTPQDLRARLEHVLAEEKTRIVVLVDDIDRLDKSEAQAVFRLLKVAADFRWTSYVLAFDPEVVADALSERYARRRNGGDEFLDKIVQVPLLLPSAPREVLRKLVFDEINRVLDDSKIELNEREVFRFITEFDAHLLHRVETPRAVKRYANALQFALPMLRGEVDVVDLLLIEAMRVFHPKLHALVQKNREMVLQGGGHVSKETIDAFKAALAEASAGGSEPTGDIRLLEGLFPRLKGIYRNTSYSAEWDQRWTKAKRIASGRYFSRYFSGGIPAGDVADADVERIMLGALADPANCAQRLKALLRDVEADCLVHKIFDIAADAEGPRAVALAHALCRAGMAFPHSRGPGYTFGARGRIAQLTAQLLRAALTPRPREIAAILSEAELAFAMLVFRSLAPRVDDTQAEELTRDEWVELGRLLLERVRDDARSRWLLDASIDGGDLQMSLWREVGDLEELRSYIVERVRDAPVRALDIVRFFCGSGRNLTTGERTHNPIEPNAYERLKSLVDPSMLAEILERLFGRPLDVAESPRHVETDQQLAHSFLMVHLAASAEGSP